MERCRILRQIRQFSGRGCPVPGRFWGIAALTLAGLAVGPARADDVGARVRGRLVDVRILVDRAPVSLYAHSWDEGPRYFAAERGEGYAIELHNRTSRRLGVLIAVDGLNVITGARSALGAHESIYVLGPRERTVIRGWRTSLDDVQQFVFVDEERSYATRSDQSNAWLGWIHVLTFEERQPLATTRVRPQEAASGEWPASPPRAPLDESRADATSESQLGNRKAAPGAGAEARAGAVERKADTPSFPGTGWGEHRRDRVRTTTFDAIEVPVDRLTFRYEYPDMLRALGLLPARHRLDERESGEVGFARPPRW